MYVQKVGRIEYTISYYDSYLEYEKRRKEAAESEMSKKFVPSSTSLMKTKGVSKGSSDLRSIDTKGLGPMSTEALPPFRKKRTSASTIGSVASGPDKKNNDGAGSSSDKNGNKSSSKECCCFR